METWSDIGQRGCQGAIKERRRAEYTERQGGKKILDIWHNPALGLITPWMPLSSPLAQHVRMFFSIWLLPPTNPICLLSVCLNFVTEKIELPNSTSTEVEMTPSSDASEPVQNGNLSHSIEAADAQVQRFFIALQAVV